MKKLKFLIAVIFFSGFQLIPSFSFAQWVSAGPDGGFINCMTKSGNTLYAVTGSFFTVSQLYKSNNNGLKWEKIESSSFPLEDIFGITSIGNSLFISSDGIYRSDDEGLTWVKKYNMGAGLLTSNSRTIYAAIQNSGILQSSDNGEHWTLSNNGLTDLWFYSITANETTVFVGTGDQNEGIFRSTDNGATWQQVNNGLSYYYNGNWIPNMPPMISALAFVGSELYAGTEENQGIWKSTNNGDNWSFTSMETMNYSSITAITGNETVVIAGSRNGGGLFKTNDDGATWTEANSGIDNYGIVTTLRMDGENTFVGTKGGIYKSVNNGSYWNASSTGIRAQNITYPGFALLGDDLYVGSGFGGIFHTTDEGAVWNDVNSGLPVSEWNLDNLYSTSTALFAWDRLSFDGGETWEMSNLYSPGSVEMDFNGPRWLEHGNAWFAIKSYDNAGVYRSIDSGQNWIPVNNGIQNPSETAFLTIYSKESTLFLGTSTGLYHSNNNGDIWQKGIFPDLNNWSLQGASFISTNSTDICGLAGGGGSRGICLSTDNGSTWTLVSDFLTYKLVKTNNTIFASGTNLELVQGEMVEVPRVLKSQDNGHSWTIASESLNNISPISLTSDGSNVYISKYSPGDNKVYISKNDGNSWIEISDGLPSAIYTSSFFINNGKIYAGTNNASIWARDISEFEAPLQPDTIAGIETPCVGSVETYVVSNIPGVSYSWQVPLDWTILSGNGTSTITVNTGNSSGIILVIPSNSFGNGPSQFKLVSPQNPLVVTATITVDQNNICSGNTMLFSVSTTNAGTEPILDWIVNGNPIGIHENQLSYIPSDGDLVKVILTSNEVCTEQAQVQSNEISTIVNSLPEVTWNSFEPDTICKNWGPVQLTGGIPEGGIYSGSGVSDNIFDPSAAGPGSHTITYTYSDENNCSAQTTNQLVVNICAGISEEDNIPYVYPNPSTGIITIGMNNNQEILNIEVYNSLGMTVYKKQGSFQSPVSVSLNDLPSGNYILKVVGRSKTIVKSIILN